MDPLIVFGRWFPAIGLGILAVNVPFMWIRLRPRIAERPELAPSYRRLLVGYIGWSSIPLLVMGAGILVGGVPTMWHFLQPRGAGPWVLAWYASILLVWTLGTWWLFAAGGAEKLANHPGMLNMPIENPSLIKALWLLVLAGGVVGFAFLFSVDIPLPL